jgi:hypothetical protein
LFWVLPPLLLSDQLVGANRGDRRALTKFMVAGIAVPLVFTIVAAILTMAGAAELSIRNQKVPDYVIYAYSRPRQLGWVKVLMLTFTLLTASRYAANVTARILGRGRGLAAGIAAPTLLLAVSLGFSNDTWNYLAWQYAAIPFAPLAGVLCGVYATTRIPQRTLDSRDRHLALLAWVLGCAATGIPMWPAGWGSASAWMVFGWAVSFAATYAARTIRRHSTSTA